MLPADLFRYCPRCGGERPAANVGKIPLRCGGCGLNYFFNPTVAAAAYVFDDAGRAVFIRRAHEPAKGKLGIPGGFVDLDETAEQALRREVREEIGIEIAEIVFLTSYPNRYTYREVTYPVLDLIFTAKAIQPGEARPLDGVAGVVWQRPADTNPAEMAFPSMRESLGLVRDRSA